MELNKGVFGTWNVEEWYDILKDHTFETCFIPLRVQDAEAILKFYDRNKKKSSKLIKDEDNESAKLIDESIKNVMGGNPIFVRCSTRSPKDSIIGTQQFNEILEKNLLNESNETLAVVKSFGEGLMCKTGEQAWNLLVNSERVYGDLTKTLLYLDENLKKQKDHVLKDEQIVIRRFDTDNIPQLEFRCFVKDNKMTMATQYFKSCFYDFIPKNKDKILQAMNDKLEIVCKLLNTTESFSIDFSYHPEIGVKVIELNPFSTQTSCGLFNWKNEIDAKIIRGESDFEFRILETEPTREQQRENLKSDIVQVIQAIQSRKTQSIQQSKPSSQCIIA